MDAEVMRPFIEFLKQDEIRNLNIINFMEGCSVHSVERIGNSVLLRGTSDCRWVYIEQPGREGVGGYYLQARRG